MHRHPPSNQSQGNNRCSQDLEFKLNYSTPLSYPDANSPLTRPATFFFFFFYHPPEPHTSSHPAIRDSPGISTFRRNSATPALLPRVHHLAQISRLLLGLSTTARPLCLFGALPSLPSRGGRRGSIIVRVLVRACHGITVCHVARPCVALQCVT